MIEPEQDLQVQDARVVSEVELAAREAGFVHPEDAASLIDRAQLRFADGRPINVPALVAELAKRKPYLVKDPVGGWIRAGVRTRRGSRGGLFRRGRR